MYLTDDPFSIMHAVTACGVIVWDATEGEIVAANQAATQILALPLDTLLRRVERRHRTTLLRPNGTALPWEERPSAIALRMGQAQRNVLVGVAYSDGQHRYLRVDAVPVRRNDGRVSWVVVSFIDVSEQANAERRGSI